jgi:hypothetical protein
MSSVFLLMALTTVQIGPTGPNTLDQTKPAPAVRERRSNAVLEWNAIALEAIRADHTPPPGAARNLAILQAAIADAVNTIYQTHTSYLVRLRATEPIDPDTTVASAAARVLISLYPAQVDRFERARDRVLDNIEPSTAKSRGITLGKYVADRLLAARRTDGADRTRDWLANPGVGVWRPTPPKYAAALYPHWGEVAPFGIRSGRKHRPAAPPDLTSSEYRKDLDEVRRLGSRGSDERTAEQSIIAWFWEGGAGTCTPPGHWNQIAAEVALDRKLSLPETARLFALLNIALADAGIVCWDCKYHFRYWRPITALRSGAGKLHERWESLLETPPFPSYVSGHSSFSGAAATVLAKFFDSDKISFTCGSDGIPGTERSYKSFWAAAEEAGRSRIYGGIHYECDNREGLALGKAVAEEVFRTRLRASDLVSHAAPCGVLHAAPPQGLSTPALRAAACNGGFEDSAFKAAAASAATAARKRKDKEKSPLVSRRERP